MNQSNACMIAILNKIKTGILLIGAAGFKVKLAQAPFAVNPNSDPTTFTEATYTGYAAATITAMGGDQQTGNSWESTAGALAAFAPTGTAVGNTIAGYWIEDNTGVLLGYDIFNPQIGMNTPADAINLAIRWQVQPANWPNTLLP
jgi:hypothetical protein